MKKNNFIKCVILVLGILISSCSSDDSSSNSTNFTGNWVHTEIQDIEPDGSISWSMDIDGCASNNVTSFSSGGNYTETWHSEEDNGSCSLSSRYVGTYTSLGNDSYRLEWTDVLGGDEGETEEFTVEYVDSNTLHLNFDREEGVVNSIYVYERL